MPKHINWSKIPLGTLPDPVIARQYGVSASAVCQARRKRGIEPCWTAGNLPKNQAINTMRTHANARKRQPCAECGLVSQGMILFKSRLLCADCLNPDYEPSYTPYESSIFAQAEDFERPPSPSFAKHVANPEECRAKVPDFGSRLTK